ncbi:Thylakoid lumenal kDa chloroplastic [Micractinium conductrix]|uniref:Thylakoid lumenal kDa chloroplastic n=1 Tax=Micractinium conductrix TaxID=554055 RepID=A0A2P6V6U2_9CHLO|nr:Thylakoid lumenal kDa chloroplastic [Micractinium conductrix]|eukprot:PSC69801.1 Thylakoid lumenal kDa chloroplastic [Micractinium conductrix]
MASVQSVAARPFAAVRVAPPRSRRAAFVAAAAPSRSSDAEQPRAVQQGASVLLSLAASAALLLGAGPAAADSNVRLPPLDKDPNRCERGFVGNTIGQANAVSNTALDLRFCKYPGANLSGKTLSGALMSETDMRGANLREVVLTKAYALKADLSGADLTNAVIDRVYFDEANLEGAQLVNAVITGTTFAGANLTGTNFEDALIGSEDAKRLCANPTLVGESRDQALASPAATCAAPVYDKQRHA